jgi:hypothetical protein
MLRLINLIINQFGLFSTLSDLIMGQFMQKNMGEGIASKKWALYFCITIEK